MEWAEINGHKLGIVNIGGKEPNGKPSAIGRWTFSTRKVRERVLDEIEGRVLNACCGKTVLEKSGVDIVRNDLNPEIDADYHTDIENALETFSPESFDCVILDPPFDQGQAEEHYGNIHARDLGTARKQLRQVVNPGGKMIEFGWSTWAVADYEDRWTREKEIRFRRGVPDRPPIFMVVDRKSQKTLGDY